MAIKQLTREEAEKLYDKTLRAMNPDKVLEDRLLEIDKESEAGLPM